MACEDNKEDDVMSVITNHDARMTIICYQQSNYRIIHHLT